MQIINLTKELANNISNIVCIGMTKRYLVELFDKYNVEEKVIAIVDKNAKESDSVVVKNNNIPLVSFEYLRHVDDNTSIIITTDYHEMLVNELIEKGYLNTNNKLFKFLSEQEQKEYKYRELYKDDPLQNIIIFRSGPIRNQFVEGTDFYDNARALFEYMIENHYNDKYELIWLVKEPNRFKKYEKLKNVKFLSFDWEDSNNEEELNEYYRVLCLAKYIFFTDAYGFARNCRKDQIRIQLWHGCGFKTRTNFSRCEDRYEYTTVISDLYKKIHADIYGLRDEQVLITGYAKQDWLFKPYKEGLDTLLKTKKSSKYIFWLPTFRVADDKLSNLTEYEINPDTGLPIIVNYEQLKKLNELLFEINITLIVKLHPFQKDIAVKDYELTNIVLIRNSDMESKDLILNRLLASADALISDYSSAAVDFLNVDRPIAFTLDDVEEYESSRGFVFENIREWLPGKEVWNFNDFCEFIKEIAEEKDTSREKRIKVTEKMLKYKDDQNCKRIVEAFNI